MVLAQELTIDLATARRETLAGIGQLRQQIAQQLTVALGVDAEQALDEVDTVADALQRIADEQVDLDVNNTAALNEIEQVDEALARIADEQVDLDVNNTAALNEIEQVERALDGIADQTVSVDVDTSNAETQIDELGDTIRDTIEDATSESGGGGFSDLANNFGARFGASAGGAAGLAFVASFGAFVEREAQVALVDVRLNLDDDELQRVEFAADQALSAGLAGSFEQAFEATGLVQGQLQEFGDVSTIELSRVTQQALALSDAFGADLEFSLRTAGQLVRNGLADNFEDAFDIITVGYQEGLNLQDDFLDTLNEYAPEFREIGLTAEDVLGLLNSGLEAGAFNSDKVADAFKEFGIRVRDETPDIAEAFETLGLSQAEFVAELERSPEAARQATLGILEQVQSIEDPLERNRVALALYGTQSEELGPQVFAALSPVSDLFEDIDGSAQSATEQLQTTEDRLRGIRNEITGGGAAAIGDIGEILSGDFSGGLFGTATEQARALRDELRLLQSAGAERAAASISGAFDTTVANALEAAQINAAQLRAELESAIDPQAVASAEQIADALEVAAGVAERQLADVEFGAIDFAPIQLRLDREAIADGQTQAAFAEASGVLASIVSESFGNPLRPSFDPEEQISLELWVDRVIELQEAINEQEFNLLAFTQRDDISDDVKDFYLQVFQEAGEEGGAVLVAEAADADAGDLIAAYEDYISQVRVGELLAETAAAAGLDIPVNIDREELDLLASERFPVEVIAELDDDELLAATRRAYDVDFRLDLDDSQLDAVRNTTLQIDGQLNLSSTGGTVNVNGISFPIGGVVPLDKGAALFEPTLALLAEAGNPEAVVGPHHNPHTVVDRLDDVGVTQNILPILAQRVFAARMPDTGPADVLRLQTEIVALRSQVVDLTAATVAAADHTAPIRTLAESAEATALAVDDLANRPVAVAVPPRDRGRPMGRNRR